MLAPPGASVRCFDDAFGATAARMSGPAALASWVPCREVLLAKGVQRTVVWLRSGSLRVHDNALLHAAQLLASKSTLPVFVVSDADVAPCRWLPATPRLGRHRAQFLAGCVRDLRTTLETAGSGLAVFTGSPADVLLSLEPDCVLTQAECTADEVAEQSAVEERLTRTGGRLIRIPGGTTYEVADSWPGSAIPGAAAYVKRLVQDHQPARPLPLPVIPRLGDYAGHAALRADPMGLGKAGHAPSCWPAGESGGLSVLRSYLWDTHAVRTYGATRNGLGSSCSTRLSPYLATGCLSPRTVAEELRMYDAAHPGHEASTGTSPGGLLFELAVRDYFRVLAERHGSRLFARMGPVGQSSPRSWSTDTETLAAWRQGRTGVPLVDAILRQLAQEGWVSNRARQIAASFGCLVLNLDWRLCAEHFESLLVDYDPASNYGNFLQVCGLSSPGGRQNWFDVQKQSALYDPDGEYVKQWVPELRPLSAEFIHRPWDADPQACGLAIGTDYPLPAWDKHHSPQASAARP